jgi:hypothetical protein
MWWRAVKEYRNGKFLTAHRKDFIIHVDDNAISFRRPDPSYITCNGFDFSFHNSRPSPLIHSYYWDLACPDLQQIQAPRPGLRSVSGYRRLLN